VEGRKGFMFYTTGRRMYPGSYRYNKDSGRFEFFIKYLVDETTGNIYKVFCNRQEVESILKNLDKHYGHTGLTARILNKVLPEKLKRQIAGDFN
jgi:hypothetical protein